MKKINLNKLITAGAVALTISSPAVAMAETIDGALNTDQTAETVEIPANDEAVAETKVAEEVPEIVVETPVESEVVEVEAPEVVAPVEDVNMLDVADNEKSSEAVADDPSATANTGWIALDDNTYQIEVSGLNSSFQKLHGKIGKIIPSEFRGTVHMTPLSIPNQSMTPKQA